MGQGNLVLLDIFSYSCMNCLRSLDYIRKIDERYNGYGLKTILVHTPEWEFEKDKRNVAFALKKYNVPFPVVMGKDRELIRKLKIDFWPTQLLVHNNKIVYRHIGEGNYKLLESKIRQILKASPKKVFIKEPLYSRFPAVYLGRKKKGKIITDRNKLRFGLIHSEGKWVQNEEYIRHVGRGGSLGIITKGSMIYAVARARKAANVQVIVDNKKKREIKVSKPGLYFIARLKGNNQHCLKLITNGKLEVYSFAFE